MRVSLNAIDRNKERMTPELRAWLKPLITKRADEIKEARSIVKKHKDWSVEIILGDTAPTRKSTDSEVIWLYIDNCLGIRTMVATFINDSDGHSEEDNIAEFSLHE